MITPQITRHKVVTMQYALSSSRNVVIREASAPPVSYLHGSGMLFPRL